MEILNSKTKEIMKERFGKDQIIAIATVQDGKPYVRNVDGYYEDGAFYVITYALSNKMKQIEENPHVAISGDWFTAHGINTCILCIRLTEGVLFSHGTKYDIDFSDISCHTNKGTLSN